MDATTIVCNQTVRVASCKNLNDGQRVVSAFINGLWLQMKATPFDGGRLVKMHEW